jgi:GLPGLI family protein
MKRLLLLLVTINSYCQDDSVGKIEYEKIYNIQNITTKFKFDLYFDNSKSLYLEQLDTINNQVKQYNNEVESIFSSVLNSEGINATYYIKNINKNYIIYTDKFLLKTYQIKDSTIVFDWKIEDEFKKINNFDCQKANVNFRGRNYIAWFSTTINVPFGPYKFNGLPGIILEIYEENKMFYAIATSINLTQNTKIIKSKIDNLNESELTDLINFQEFEQIKEKEFEEFKSIISSKLPRGNSDLKGERKDKSKTNLEILE